MSRWSPADVPDQSGRTALVTGANSGLGLHTALELARRGARVLLAVRRPERGEQAAQRVLAEVPAARLEVVPLDLADLASVRAAATDVAGRVGALDLLVDNAGIMAVPRSLTPDGFESQLATNHLGHFALTGLLLPQLLAGTSPRVVVVSSGAHRTGRIAFDDLHGERSYSRWGAYGQSKLANLLFARELQRRAGDRLLVAAAHPGYAATHLQSGQSAPLMEAFMKLGNLLVAQSDAQGAWPSLYAATMPDVRPGDYWGPSLAEVRGVPKRVGRSAAAQDDAAAALLWDRSEELTGVSYDALGAPA
jgi:NAD(P)-dependent dehydrogenase (short-subunit alcohol dehydrogenase family)